uniref:DFDF domain-containing protein n=2 Tax=Timspurckia oligopyrenoides TaxID=708627 RepID=A0A7S0ZDS0_9RHOD|mmetsp:Transcript_13716/g.24609  ORF Transcript_13716/g.24609 Transcript_13716/m.24609 type:complete len:146 (+) Transcript_13716:128-565(+)
MRGRGGGSRGGSGRGRGGRGGARINIPSEDFDFEAMNEKFDLQQVIEKEEVAISELNIAKKYDKNSSFFDELASEKTKIPSRAADFETFGETATRRFRGRGGSSYSRGASRGGGYGRGGYAQRGNRGRGSSGYKPGSPAASAADW